MITLHRVLKHHIISQKYVQYYVPTVNKHYKYRGEGKAQRLTVLQRLRQNVQNEVMGRELSGVQAESAPPFSIMAAVGRSNLEFLALRGASFQAASSIPMTQYVYPISLFLEGHQLLDKDLSSSLEHLQRPFLQTTSHSQGSEVGT